MSNYAYIPSQHPPTTISSPNARRPIPTPNPMSSSTMHHPNAYSATNTHQMTSRSNPESIATNQQQCHAINYLAQKMHPNVENPLDHLNSEEISYLQIYLEQMKKNKLDNKMIMKRDHTKCLPGSENAREAERPNGYMGSSGRGESLPQSFQQQGTPNRLDESRSIHHNYQQRIQGNNQMVPNQPPMKRINDFVEPVQRDVPLPLNFRDQQNNRTWQITPNSGIPLDRGSMATNIGKKSDRSYHNPYEYGAKQDVIGSLYQPTYTGPYSADDSMLDKVGITEQQYFERFPGATRNADVESSLLQGEVTHLPGQRNLTMKEINRFQLLPFDPQDTKHIVWEDNMPRGGYPTRVDRIETM